jgi:hypothetical protein
VINTGSERTNLFLEVSPTVNLDAKLAWALLDEALKQHHLDGERPFRQ